jgi:hypothetical protein
MFKRWITGMLFCLLLGVGAASAQDGGSTLQAWADTYTTAYDVTQQIEWPHYERTFTGIDTYEYDDDDPAIPTCASGHSYSLWLTFIAPQTSRITTGTLGSNFNTVTAVYKNTPTVANQIACLNATSPGVQVGTFNVKAGTRYYMLLAATGVGTGVDSTSALTQIFYTNYDAANPFQIPATGVYSNIQGYIETADPTYKPAGACTNFNYGVYYRFRPSVSGRYEFSTNGSSYDTLIHLRDGASLSVCNENINLNNHNSRIRANLVAGTTYYLDIGQSDLASPVQAEGLLLSLQVRKL